MTDIAMVRMLEERDAEIKHLTTEVKRLQTELRLWSTEAEREVALWHNEVDRLARGWATPTYAIRRALEQKP